MLSNLSKYKVVLASNSPRRQALLEGLGIDFKVRTLDSIDESYPVNLDVKKVAQFIAKRKADAYKSSIVPGELLITADTVVVSKGLVLGKPKTKTEAVEMLKGLSGDSHQVITGVCLLTIDSEYIFDAVTDVQFAHLTPDEIEYYVDEYAPFDKAGAYGVQEWIGYIGVESIQGSYYNVMGLPIQRLYRELKKY